MIKYLIFILLLLQGCTLFIGETKDDIFSKNDISPQKVPDQLFCPEKQTFSLISENEKSSENFKRFLKKIAPKYNLTFIEKVVLWSLAQFNIRPDNASPHAKLQYLIEYDGNEKYMNTSSKTSGASTLTALKNLLAKNKSKYSLERLADIIDEEYTYSFFASKTFENFLKKNKSALLQDGLLKRIYLRGDETLREGERIPKLSFSTIIKSSKKDKDSNINSELFNYNKNSYLETNCNFEFSIYENSWFFIAPQKKDSHIFGIQEGRNKFMAMSTLSIPKIETYTNSHLFKGNSQINGGAICSFKHKKWSKNSLWLLSTNSRDPAQHLYHLFEYGLEEVSNVESLSSMLSFSRHLFLKNPMRLIIESRKSQEDQIQELLKLKIPLYNAKNLGKIWGMIDVDKNPKFVLDPRREGFITCN